MHVSPMGPMAATIALEGDGKAPAVAAITSST